MRLCCTNAPTSRTIFKCRFQSRRATRSRSVRSRGGSFVLRGLFCLPCNYTWYRIVLRTRVLPGPDARAICWPLCLDEGQQSCLPAYCFVNESRVSCLKYLFTLACTSDIPKLILRMSCMHGHVQLLVDSVWTNRLRLTLLWASMQSPGLWRWSACEMTVVTGLCTTRWFRRLKRCLRN